MTAAAASIATPSEPAFVQQYELEHHVAKAVFYAQAAGTVVTFEPLNNLYDPSKPVEGTGERFYNGIGYNTVSILPRRHSWYRTLDVLQFLAELSASGTLDRYPMTATFGFSMGAYGAMAYAALLKADLALTIGPITSIDPRVAPFETRFAVSPIQDWDGPCVDGAEGVAETARFVTVYDPLTPIDRQHVGRVKAARAAQGLGGDYLALPGVGHKAMAPLLALEMMKPLSVFALENRLDPVAFAKAARGRRRLERYYYAMGLQERIKASPRFRKIITDREAEARRAGKLIPMMEDAAEIAAVEGANKVPWALMPGLSQAKR